MENLNRHVFWYRTRLSRNIPFHPPREILQYHYVPVISLSAVRGSISLKLKKEEKSDVIEAEEGQKNTRFSLFKKKSCPKCGGRISITYLQCPKCGIKLK
jgi:hypothetical protein